jgi:hypothetical protein
MFFEKASEIKPSSEDKEKAAEISKLQVEVERLKNMSEEQLSLNSDLVSLLVFLCADKFALRNAQLMIWYFSMFYDLLFLYLFELARFARERHQVKNMYSFWS